MKEDKAKIFEAGSQYNILANALVKASDAENFRDEDYKIYEFFEKVPKTSLVIEICDALNSFGYSITPTSPPPAK